MIELIFCTKKNDINVKRCMDGMKEMALTKLKPEIGDDGFTPSQDMTDMKIFE